MNTEVFFLHNLVTVLFFNPCILMLLFCVLFLCYCYVFVFCTCMFCMGSTFAGCAFCVPMSLTKIDNLI